MADKICFVISPLSERGSTIRREADDLLWVINQALSKHGFKVIRIDEIAKTHEITREIVRYIEDSELCVIILTGDNPNVFYEAGRRHQTGKPFIHLVKEGEKLPFDVAGINTIHYGDINNLENTKELAEAIERFAVNMASEIEGHSEPRQGTLEGLAQILEQIDRKVSRLASVAPAPALGGPSGLDDPRTTLRNPKEAFMVAIATGDLGRATALLPRLEELLGRNEEFHRAVMMCTGGGSEAAAKIARDMLSHRPEWFTDDAVVATIGALVSYYSLRDLEDEGIDLLFPLIDQELENEKLSVENRAQLLNQKQRLLFGARRFQEALPLAEQILQLQPDEPSFYHNASMIYEALKLYKKAAEMADRVLEFDTKDPDHLAQAVDVYIADKQVEKAKRTFHLLRQVDPRKAALKLASKEFRKIMGDI